ncbi:MAG: DnaJ domain-containing protein [Abditibacteriales bacterium]|nr:DnaJ domain-containing protein [Abditibacteriales bacterium]MDW8366683.1 DnaJ domain-containing protein [Abditibacteriales bacterium]
MPDYYKVLGVARNATEEDIKRAYRKLAKEYQVAAARGDQEATEKMKQINEAYGVLKDPVKRQEYDGITQPTARRTATTGAGPRRSPTAPSAGATMPPMAGDPLTAFLNQMRQQAVSNVRGAAGAPPSGATASPSATASRATARAGRDGEVELLLTAEEARQGTVKVLNVDGQPVRVRVPPGQREGSVVPLVLRVRLRR